MLPLDVEAVRAILAEAGEAQIGEPEPGHQADPRSADPRSADPRRAAPRSGAAAVAAILRDGAQGAEVLLIRRAQREGDPWSGQMALPGGRRDPADATLLETAVRETLEEIGVDLAGDATLLGQLDDVEVVPRAAHSRGWIRPFVFALRGPLGALTLAPLEVDEVVWASLHDLRSGALATTTTWSREGVTMTFPAWDVDGRIVWGLTYRMMQSLLERFGEAPSTEGSGV